MTSRRFERTVLHRTIVMMTLVCATVVGHAQEQEGDLVYRFSVHGVSDPASAKPVQYAMMDQGFVHACVFIEECSCFKLASPVPLGYDALKTLLINSGFLLIGPVQVSDGTSMVPNAPVLEGK